MKGGCEECASLVQRSRGGINYFTDRLRAAINQPEQASTLAHENLHILASLALADANKPIIAAVRDGDSHKSYYITRQLAARPPKIQMAVGAVLGRSPSAVLSGRENRPTLGLVR